MNITKSKELINDIQIQQNLINDINTLLRTEKFENENQLMIAGTLLFVANRTANILKTQLIQEINK